MQSVEKTTSTTGFIPGKTHQMHPQFKKQSVTSNAKHQHSKLALDDTCNQLGRQLQPGVQ